MAPKLESITGISPGLITVRPVNGTPLRWDLSPGEAAALGASLITNSMSVILADYGATVLAALAEVDSDG